MLKVNTRGRDRCGDMKLCDDDLRLVRDYYGLIEVEDLEPLRQVEDDYTEEQIISWRIDQYSDSSGEYSMMDRIVDDVCSNLPDPS